MWDLLAAAQTQRQREDRKEIPWKRYVEERPPF
jgi:hypothetical protein